MEHKLWHEASWASAATARTTYAWSANLGVRRRPRSIRKPRAQEKTVLGAKLDSPLLARILNALLLLLQPAEQPAVAAGAASWKCICTWDVVLVLDSVERCFLCPGVIATRFTCTSNEICLCEAAVFSPSLEVEQRNVQ